MGAKGKREGGDHTRTLAVSHRDALCRLETMHRDANNTTETSLSGAKISRSELEHEPDRQTGRQTGRQTDRQTDMQAVGQRVSQ